jgi:hypothetical protein
MPKRTANEDEKEMKPKQIAKIVLDIYDNGYVDKNLSEYYINDETKKRKKFDHDSVKDFKQCFKELLTDDPDEYVVSELLKALDVNPQAYARKVIDKKPEATPPEEQ